MSLNRVRRTHTLFARLTAAVIVATGVPILIASSASADAGPGSSAENPITITNIADLPAGAVETGSSLQECATVKTYTTTVPAVAETFHDEYRWPLEKRTYSPGQQEVSHLVYSYKKVTPAVSEVKEYTFDKFVQRQKARWSGTTYIGPISAGYPGSYDWKDAGYAPVVNTTGVVPTAPGPVRGDYIHNNNGTWYFTLFYEYRKIGERVITAAQPEKVEYSGERTTTLGSPWVLLSGYPKKVVDSAAVPASFTAWGFDAFTAWSTNAAAPADPDGQDGEANALNLRRVGSPMESKKVSNNDAKPAVVTYYRYSDAKVCEVVTPTPTPTPTPVATPTPTPTPTPEVLGVQAGRATGKLSTSCQGTVRATLKNASSSTVTYKIKVGKKVFTTKVKADKTKAWSTKAKNLQTAKLMIGNRVLAKAKVPKACLVPEVLPETGKRHK